MLCRSFAVVFGVEQFGESYGDDDGNDEEHDGRYAEKDADER